MNRRWLFWVLCAVTLALVAASATLQLLRTAKSSNGKSAAELTMLAKLAVAGATVPGSVADAYEKPFMEALDKMIAEGVRRDQARALRRKAIWCAYREQECAGPALTSLGLLSFYDRLPAPADEAQLLREALLGPVTPERLPELSSRLSELRLGFFDHLVRERLYRNAGDPAAADAARDAARSSAVVALVALFTFSGLLGAGFIAWLVLLVTPARKRVFARIGESLRERDDDPPGAVSRRLLVVIVFLSLSLAVPQIAAALHFPASRSPAARAGWTLALELGLFLVVLGAHRVFAGRGVKLGFARVRPVRAAGVGALSYLLVWPVLVVVLVPLSSLFEKLGLPNQTHPIVDQLQAAGNDPRTLAMWLVIAAVLAPLLEEAVFRGALQSALQGRLGGVFALIATALLFAIIHPQVGLGLVGVLVLGLMLSLVRLHERSLWPGVVLHAINNGVALLIVTALLSP
ncbi:MAG: type II CAAX endopeptidase family protein [Polyangiaceae bacterium]